MWLVNVFLALVCCVLALVTGEYRIALPWGLAALYAFVVYVKEAK